MPDQEKKWEKDEAEYNKARSFLLINYLLFFGFLFVMFSEQQICDNGEVSLVLIAGIAAILFSVYSVYYTAMLVHHQRRGPDLVIGSGLALLLLLPPVLIQIMALPHCG